MRIAIVADTHGRIEAIKKQLTREKPELILFAGDFLADARRLSYHLGIQTQAVLGNCDSSSSGEWERVLEVANRRIYVVHGHQYGVKHSLNTLFYRGQELGVEAVVFGHTHIPCCEQVEGMWMLNPGSASRPRIGKKPSYIWLQADESTFRPEIIYFSI